MTSGVPGMSLLPRKVFARIPCLHFLSLSDLRVLTTTKEPPKGTLRMGSCCQDAEPVFFLLSHSCCLFPLTTQHRYNCERHKASTPHRSMLPDQSCAFLQCESRLEGWREDCCWLDSIVPLTLIKMGWMQKHLVCVCVWYVCVCV